MVLILLGMAVHAPVASAEETPVRNCSDPPVIRSSWDDLLEGIDTREDWQDHHKVLKRRCYIQGHLPFSFPHSPAAKPSGSGERGGV